MAVSAMILADLPGFRTSGGTSRSRFIGLLWALPGGAWALLTRYKLHTSNSEHKSAGRPADP
ncbi:hypothetical protein PJI74_29430, partial [Mycobacterium kansasii]